MPSQPPAKPEALVMVCRWPRVRVLGSRKIHCSRCNEVCGVSPATLKQVTEKYTPVYVCGPCTTSEDIEAMKGNLVMPSAAVLTELLDTLTGPSLN